MNVTNLGLGVSLALGGLGLFLISVKLLSNGLKKVSGDKLRNILRKFTKTNVHSLIFGLLFTTMIQSSDGAVALVISLVAAGLLPLKSALAFVLGANIGTATTSIIVSMSSNFSFTQYFMILAFIGGMGFLLIKDNARSNIALILASIGLLFLGLKVMGAGMKSVASQDAFKSIISAVGTNSWLSTLTSLAMTGLMQSSSASVTVAQTMYDTTTSMSIEGAIGFVIGANIGTTVTAFLTTAGGNKDTKRIAVFWMITNLSVALLILPITKYYAMFVSAIVPQTYSGHGGYNNFQMSIAHVFFNVFLVMIFMPLIGQVTKLTKWIVKEDKEVEFKYDANLPVDLISNSPQLALEVADKAFYTMGKMNLDSLKTIEKLLDKKDAKYSIRIEKLGIAMKEARKGLHDFITMLNTESLTEDESSRTMKLAMAARSQERISDLIIELEKIITATFDKKNKWFKLSTIAFDEISQSLVLVKKIQERSIEQSMKFSKSKLVDIRTLRDEINSLVEESIENHEERVKNDQCETPSIDYYVLMHIFERIASHQYKMAKYFKPRKDIRTLMKEAQSERLQRILDEE